MSTDREMLDAAAVGDVVATDLREPYRQTIRLTLDTQAAVDHFNSLTPERRAAWRLERRAADATAPSKEAP